MSEEFDVFAQAAKPAQGAKSEADAQQAPRQKPDAKPAAKRAPYRKGAMPRARQRAAKPNNSPLRGPSADGSECVNPLLNAPLPKEKPAEVQEQGAGLIVGFVHNLLGWPFLGDDIEFLHGSGNFPNVGFFVQVLLPLVPGGVYELSAVFHLCEQAVMPLIAIGLCVQMLLVGVQI